MLTIWGRTPSSNVQKVMWTVAELGLEHERIDAGRSFGGLDTDAYGAMNPNRRIPTIRDGELVLWESNVIVRYLAAKYGPGTLWPHDVAVRAVADQWMDWQQTTLVPDMWTIYKGLTRTPADQRDDAAIEAAVVNVQAIWRRLDAWLADRRYVAGDELTMGDIPVGVLCYRYHALGVARGTLDHVERWYERLLDREPFRRHVVIPFS